MILKKISEKDSVIGPKETETTNKYTAMLSVPFVSNLRLSLGCAFFVLFFVNVMSS